MHLSAAVDIRWAKTRWQEARCTREVSEECRASLGRCLRAPQPLFRYCAALQSHRRAPQMLRARCPPPSPGFCDDWASRAYRVACARPGRGGGCRGARGGRAPARACKSGLGAGGVIRRGVAPAGPGGPGLAVPRTRFSAKLGAADGWAYAHAWRAGRATREVLQRGQGFWQPEPGNVAHPGR